MTGHDMAGQGSPVGEAGYNANQAYSTGSGAGQCETEGMAEPNAMADDLFFSIISFILQLYFNLNKECFSLGTQ